MSRAAPLALAALAIVAVLRPAGTAADDVGPPAGAVTPERRQQRALPKDIDHFLTGFPLRGAHVNVACESCHARGILPGTPRLCSDCHRSSGPVRASAKPLDHVVTRAECDRCHSERSWLGARFIHSLDTAARCVSCHNGRAASGKSRDHIPSPDTCQDCHNTRTFSLD